jgi:hypothetical protein
MSHRGGCGAVTGTAAARREGPAGREGCARSRRTAGPALAGRQLTPKEPHPCHIVVERRLVKGEASGVDGRMARRRGVTNGGVRATGGGGVRAEVGCGGLGRRAVGAPPAGYLIRNRGRHHAQAAPTPPHVGSPHEGAAYPGEPGRNEAGSRQASAH